MKVGVIKVVSILFSIKYFTSSSGFLVSSIDITCIVKLKNARQLWYWEGAASLLQLAKEGTTKPKECKFTVTVDEITICDVCEIIPCSEEAIKSINSVTEWREE